MKSFSLQNGLILLFCCYTNLFSFKADAQGKEKEPHRIFSLSGHIVKCTREKIYLLYSTEDSGTIIDSCKIEKGKFSFKGKLTEPIYAELSFNKDFDGYSLDYATVFLEPGATKVRAVNDSLRFLTMVKGGVSQKENEQLANNKKSTWLKLYSLQNELSKERKSNTLSENGKDSSQKQAIDRLQKVELKLYNMMFKIDSQFIIANPASYVTAYLIKKNLEIEHISFYPVDSLYYKMPVSLQASSYGRSILWHMNKVNQVPLGSKAPAFSAVNQHGERIDLDDFKGKSYVLLDFWGSWCVPCRQLAPGLKWLYENYQQKGLKIISVALRDNEKAWQEAIAKDGTNMWYHVMGDGTISKMYSADWLPVLFLINREGNVKGRYAIAQGYGEKPIWQLYKELETLFGQTVK
jgi:thiol-disulfide isomerase/thioredoxin